MKEYIYDVAVIGAGPAGLAAGIGAREGGAERVVIIERDFMTGGILPQCIHNGFGLHNLSRDLTGPEYAEIYAEKAAALGIEIKLETMVLEVIPAGKVTPSGLADFHTVTGVSGSEGLICIKAKAVILAMGCRERTRGNIMLPGTRPAGIFTAGLAQRFTNIEGYLPGKNIVILGSGDIGMIMARRLTFEGASVKAIVEVMSFLGGLSRNRVQCLDDFNIPVYLNHTVTYIRGNSRVEGVEIAEIDDEKKIIEGTRRFIECDTLLLSVGLIPENELTEKAGIKIDPKTKGPEVDSTFQTSADGIFACGNVMHVSDLVDYVSEDGIAAGKAAAQWAKTAGKVSGKRTPEARQQFLPGKNVSYVVPQAVYVEPDYAVKNDNTENIHFKLSFRVTKPMRNAKIMLTQGESIIHESKVKTIVRPGEMERIEVTDILLKLIKSRPESAEIKNKLTDIKVEVLQI